MGKAYDQDAPQRPADAYYELARHLGEPYFLAPTPQVGQLLVIIGRDGVETRWHLTPLQASRTAEWVHDQPGLALLKRMAYDRRGRTP